MVTQEQKQWWKSKTLWLNIGTIVVGVTTWAMGQAELGAPITLVGVMNAVLRVISKSEITF